MNMELRNFMNGGGYYVYRNTKESLFNYDGFAPFLLPCSSKPSIRKKEAIKNLLQKLQQHKRWITIIMPIIHGKLAEIVPNYDVSLMEHVIKKTNGMSIFDYPKIDFDKLWNILDSIEIDEIPDEDLYTTVPLRRSPTQVIFLQYE